MISLPATNPQADEVVERAREALEVAAP
jgi:hypothetical protein